MLLYSKDFSYEQESSAALGQGFRCGFLGLLHMEVIRERLEREFNIQLITTAPSVVYQITDNNNNLTYVLDGIERTFGDYIGNSATVCSVVPNISTNCFTTGAFMESNLSSFEIKGNPTGTILIWKDGKAIPCEEEYDVTVLGVAADNNESPIIIGAEPVLVTGPINEGDFIVTSDKRGHGKKGFSNNLFGKVIAQALESGDGDSYTIKAMIRKM